jgi:LCP family protein required for cell wall assembly
MQEKPMANRRISMVKKSGRFDRLTLIVLGVFAVLAVITGIVAFNVARDIFKSWTATDIQGVPVEASNGGPNNSTNPGVPLDQPLQTDGPEPDPWDGKSRVTVLVMGLDYRDWEAGDPPRSDTMILLTLDPLTNTAGMLSIPRDMWVNIPGYDYAKINTAYFLGEVNRLPGGGPGLAVETVKQFLGVPINYYAQIDFNAFVRIIDELGGVIVTVDEPITITIMGSNKKVNLEPGTYALPGDHALAYARNRKTAGNDFDRADRTQQVIMGVRDRLLNVKTLPTLITKAPFLFNELASGINTNMTLDQIIKLAWLTIDIPQENIKQAVISPDMVQFAVSADGQDILIPIPDEIRLLRDEVFSSSGAVGPAAVSQDETELMRSEQARISVQNGTSTEGMASRTAEWFRGLGLNVVDESNADQLYDTTTIYIYNGKPYTVRYLASVMGLENPRVYNRYDPNAQYDIAVAIGADWVNSNKMP